MRLLEAYSQYCGVPTGIPFIYKEYFPLPFDKYIVCQAGAGMESKKYDYFSHVIEHIKYPVIQIGGKDDERFSVPVNLCGSTNFNQSAYLIQHASLFLGCDSACNHIASALNVPRIALFGSTSPLTCGGAWNTHKAIEMTPIDYMGCAAPCHADQCIRPKKCINSITPEMILAQISQILGPDSVRPVKIVHIGVLSKQPVLELVPKSINQETFNIMQQVNGIMSVRGDLCEPPLEEFSNFCNNTNLKFVVLLNPCDINKFKIHHSKIERLLFVINKDNVKEGMRQMKEMGKRLYKTGLISYLDHSEFNEHKLDMLDYPPIGRIVHAETTPELMTWTGKPVNLKSNRKVLGKDGKFYLTYHDALKEQNLLEISADNVNLILEAEHLKESNYFTIRHYGT